MQCQASAYKGSSIDHGLSADAIEASAVLQEDSRPQAILKLRPPNSLDYSTRYGCQPCYDGYLLKCILVRFYSMSSNPMICSYSWVSSKPLIKEIFPFDSVLRIGCTVQLISPELVAGFSAHWFTLHLFYILFATNPLWTIMVNLLCISLSITITAGGPS